MPDEKTGRLDEELVVQMKGITKVYPNGVAANQGVDFTLRKGEIHALMGENGAGKSTLMKMLFGLEQPTSGEIWVNGEKLNLTAPSVAIAHGIGMVHQHFMLVPSLTVAENMVLGMAPRKGLFLDHQKAVEITKEYAERFNLHVEPEAKVVDIPVGMKQKVEILKALVRGAKILILDEPTAGLDPKERIRIRNLISDLSQDRIVLIATHVVSDIEFISKEILLMKNGRLIDKASPEQLQAKIQGKVFEMSVGQQELEEVKEKFEISNLFRKDGQIIVRVVTQKRPEGYNEIREAAPTLEDVYLYEFEVKGAMHNNAVRKIAGT